MARKLFAGSDDNRDNRFWDEMSLLLGGFKSKSRYYDKNRERALYERDIAMLLKKAQKEDSEVYKALVRRYVREMKPMREFDARKIKRYAARNTSPGMLIKCRTRDGRVRYYLNAGYDEKGRPVVKKLNRKQCRMFLSRKMRREIENEYKKRNRGQLEKRRPRNIFTDEQKRKRVERTLIQKDEEPVSLNWYEKRFVELAKKTTLGNADIFARIITESANDAALKRDLDRYLKNKKIRPVDEIEDKKELIALEKADDLANLRRLAMKEKAVEIITKERKEMLRIKKQIASPSLG